jgi:hypothetical protein
MDYMLTLCLAPENTEITEVPIKLWVKYMPDTIDRLIRDIYNVPTDSSFDMPVGANGPQPALGGEQEPERELDLEPTPALS